MLPSHTESQGEEICEGLHELIQDPKSFGLREHLPQRVLDLLAETRKAMLEYVNDGRGVPAMDNVRAAELSRDTDAQFCFREEEKFRPFSILLGRRMEQLSLSPHDVAMSLGSTLQYVSDLRSGIKAPTEQRMAELALLLAVTQDTLRTAVRVQVNA